MNTIMLKRSVGTHDGSLHADEVTACALLTLFDLIDADKIFRTRSQKILDQCEFVCDVGGIYDPLTKRFDHHQIEYDGLLSSAGMVLLYLRDEGVIDAGLYAFFNQTLVMGVDACDNGLVTPEEGHLSFSQIISTYNPLVSRKATDEQYDEAFYKAFHFTLDLLKHFKVKYEYELQCREIVAEKMKEKSHVLIFDEPLPWLHAFFNLGGETHPAKFVVMPAGKHWKLRGIPPSFEERMATRQPHPQPWAGLMNEELQQKTNIPGAIFCHKGRFISVWETKEDALKALKQVVLYPP